MNGKGSKPRPLSVPYETYSDNYDNIFRKTSIVEVKELPNGDQFIEIPEDMMKTVGWKEGDEIEWEENASGYNLKKKK